jgi:membrane associated rhomboid family serine protease
MFPIRDDNPQLYIPFVTFIIIALNAAAWIFIQGLGNESALIWSVCRLGLIPGDLLGNVEMVRTSRHLLCPIDGQGSWLTIVSSMFLHGGWMHIVGNMWFLWIFGGNVEDAMGHVRFLFFYILCGIAAAAAQVIANPASPVPMVGASGAIGGVMGAYIMLYPRVHVHMLFILGFYITTFAVPAVFMLGYWIIVQVVGGMISVGAPGGGVAFWAHVGGFAAGAVLILLFKDSRLLDKHPYHGWRQKKHATRLWHQVSKDRRRRW